MKYDDLYGVIDSWIINLSNVNELRSLLLVNRLMSRVVRRILARYYYVFVKVERDEIVNVKLIKKTTEQAIVISDSLYFYLLGNGEYNLNTSLVVLLNVEDVDPTLDGDYLPMRMCHDAVAVKFQCALPFSWMPLDFDLFSTEKWRNVLLFLVRNCPKARSIIVVVANFAMGDDQVFDFLSAMQFVIGWFVEKVLPHLRSECYMCLKMLFAIKNAVYNLSMSETHTDLKCKIFASEQIEVFFQLITSIVAWFCSDMLPLLRRPTTVMIHFINAFRHNGIETAIRECARRANLNVMVLDIDENSLLRMRTESSDGTFAILWRVTQWVATMTP